MANSTCQLNTRTPKGTAQTGVNYVPIWLEKLSAQVPRGYAATLDVAGSIRDRPILNLREMINVNDAAAEVGA